MLHPNAAISLLSLLSLRGATRKFAVLVNRYNKAFTVISMDSTGRDLYNSLLFRTSDVRKNTCHSHYLPAEEQKSQQVAPGDQPKFQKVPFMLNSQLCCWLELHYRPWHLKDFSKGFFVSFVLHKYGRSLFVWEHQGFILKDKFAA